MGEPSWPDPGRQGLPDDSAPGGSLVSWPWRGQPIEHNVGLLTPQGGCMGAINAGRVIGGGLLAGVVINLVEFVMNMFVLADSWAGVYETMGIAEPGGGAVAGFVVLGFVLGILIAWVYAAIRPRFGAGPGTAVKAGLAVWVAAVFFPVVGWLLMGPVPIGLAFITLAYGWVEVVAGGLVAGRVYQEAGGTR